MKNFSEEREEYEARRDYTKMMKELAKMADKLLEEASELGFYVFKNRRKLGRNPDKEKSMQKLIFTAGTCSAGILSAVHDALEEERKKVKKGKREKEKA